MGACFENRIHSKTNMQFKNDGTKLITKERTIEINSVDLRKLVKSNYIFEFIFSFLPENKKLNLIICNKNLQKKFGVNIESYKEISQKYFEGNRNGFGKIYKLNPSDNHNEKNRIDYGKLLFEGKFLKGKKNGKGKEFYENGQLKFEGKYSNGNKIKGKGFNENSEQIFRIDDFNDVKEYYYDFKLKFKGTYIDKKKWNGKGYDIKEKKIYEIKNGCGIIKEYDEYGKIIFEGEYWFGKLWNGIKYEYNNAGDLIYKGEIKKGEKNGIGNEFNIFNHNIIFEGEYLNGKKNGKGKEYDINGKLIFEGEYLNGVKNGKGKKI